jgi:hypothetical protein
MPLLTELIVFILCSYKDFAPTELVIRSDRDLAEVFQSGSRRTRLNCFQRFRLPPSSRAPATMEDKSPHLPFSYVGQVAPLLGCALFIDPPLRPPASLREALRAGLCVRFFLRLSLRVYSRPAAPKALGRRVHSRSLFLCSLRFFAAIQVPILSA